MRLLLIRHGQTPANVRGELATVVPGPSLTDLGRAQAASIPNGLRTLGMLDGIGSITVSGLTRTHETAAPLAAELGLEPSVLPNLREIPAGDLEGSSGPEAQLAYISAAWAWATGDLSTEIPGGESGAFFTETFDAAIDAIVASALERGDAAAVVIGHGASLRLWIGRNADPGDEAASMRTNHLENTGLVIVDGDPGSWRITRWLQTPIGGAELADVVADDPTGEARPIPTSPAQLGFADADPDASVTETKGTA